ncbi:MAG: hypothetical protein J7L96_06295 [Bacteroidales bacterium]|nr:hypothetical protein [Bacteroidales bacterium]
MGTKEKKNVGTPDENLEGNDPENQQPENNEWEKKYKGLQTAYNALYAKNEELTAKLNEATSNLESLKVEVASSKETLGLESKKTEDLTVAIEEKTKAYDKLRNDLDRKLLIMEKYPDLSNLEAKGILPMAENEEELIEKLNIFSEAIDERTKAIVANKIKGSSPGTKTHDAGEKLTQSQILDRLYSIAGDKSKRDEYERLNNILLEMK